MSFAGLYESPELLAIDKPIGVATVPGRGETTSVIELLSSHYAEKLYVVHRLDKEVSGVLLIARSAEMHRWLNQQFESRLVHKTYLALVQGSLSSDRGCINAPIREFGSGRMGVDEAKGKPSVTNYRVLQRFSHSSLVEAMPETGRRHQLRVHFYHLGHAILGDLKYGDRLLQATYPRLMLHAASITFHLPNTNELTITSPVPELFTQTIATMKS